MWAKEEEEAIAINRVHQQSWVDKRDLPGDE